MGNSNIECPACGSENVKKIVSIETRTLTMGSEISYSVPMFVCENCHEEGDFSGEAEMIHESQFELARQHLAQDLVKSISDSGMKLAYVERSFEIPQRTISSKWGTGKISAAGLALLRIVKSMPWIVDIADQGFSDVAIKNVIGAVWGNYLKDQLGKNGFTLSGSVVYGQSNDVHIQITRNPDHPNMVDFGPVIALSS